MDPASARQELASIRSLMAESQAFLSGTWHHQLVWGLLAAGGLTATWRAVVTESTGAIPWVWGITLVAGWAGSIVLMRARRSGPVRNVATRAFGGIWLAVGVTLTLVGSLAVFAGAIEPSGLPGVLAVLFGAGYFACGFVGGLGWMTAVGVAWWASGAALFFLRGPWTLLLLAGLVVALEVVPAVALWSRDRGSRRV